MFISSKTGNSFFSFFTSSMSFVFVDNSVILIIPEIILNKLTGIVATQNKEAEITLKINLDSIKQFEEVDEDKVKEWVEPRIEYSISEKIKEVKNTNKGNLGFDYQVKVDEETNVTYVEKINEQTSMF